jgi:hypothetical protein
VPWNAAVTLERTYERSFNLLEGYRYAHMVARALRSELVYLLEEDVWVARDYFAFHRAAHAHRHLAIGGMPPAVRGPLAQLLSPCTVQQLALTRQSWGCRTNAADLRCSCCRYRHC